jgi:ligand-binding SRPBCC domain-containing protein
VMEDRVFYTPPLGVLGRMAHRIFIAPTLRSVFRYRGDVIRLRFGEDAAAHQGGRPVRYSAE